jgi:hypothetical protein
MTEWVRSISETTLIITNARTRDASYVTQYRVHGHP